MNWYKKADKNVDKKQLMIGVVGYSTQEFDMYEGRLLISKAFDQIEEEYKDTDFIVVSGFTDLGVPALAYREADKRGWGTVGVAPKIGPKEYDCYDCDEEFIVGEDWGDESETFLSMIDYFVKVGGGEQSTAELEQWKSKDKPYIEYDLGSE